MPVKARRTAELAGTAPHYLLRTCKGYDLDAAIDAIAPVVGPSTALVPLLNGLTHLDRLNGRFSREQILPGTVSLQVRQRDDGTIEHLNDWQFIPVGEQDGEISDRAENLVAALDAAEVTPTAGDDIIQNIWEKLVMLVTLAAITTLMRAPIGRIDSAPGDAELNLRTLELIATAAAYADHPVPEPQLQQ